MFWQASGTQEKFRDFESPFAQQPASEASIPTTFMLAIFECTKKHLLVNYVCWGLTYPQKSDVMCYMSDTIVVFIIGPWKVAVGRLLLNATD